MLAHLGDVLVEIAHDGERNVAVPAVDRFDQLAADQGQAEIEEIAVRVLQIAYQSLDRKRRIDLFGGRMVVEQQVDDRQESFRIDAAVLTDFADRFVSESERYAEPAEYQKHRIIFADQVAHSVGLLVSAEFVHLHFRFSRLVRYDKDNYFARLASVGSVVSRCRPSEAYRRTALRIPNATSKFALSAATGNPCKSVFRAVRIPIFG